MAIICPDIRLGTGKNERMKAQTQTVLKSSIVSGMVYATIMAGFDYFDEQGFSLWKFIFHASFFGIVMGLITKYNLKKRK